MITLCFIEKFNENGFYFALLAQFSSELENKLQNNKLITPLDIDIVNII